MTEKELVLCAQAGDVDAFCTLYDRYKRKLYNYAYYKLGNTQDAEDAVQDCMLTAYARLEQLKKRRPLPPGSMPFCIMAVWRD